MPQNEATHLETAPFQNPSPVSTMSDSQTSVPSPHVTAAPRTRALQEVPELAQRAVDLLCSRSVTQEFTRDDAQCVVRYLRLVHVVRGAKLFVEGDAVHTGHMLLVLEGEVSVDMLEGGGSNLPVEVSVVSAGQLLGELALLDGAPRSATCTAITDVRAAGLSRQGLQLLIKEHPAVGAKLMLTVAQHISDRLRAMGEQLRMYSQLVAEQQDSLARLRSR
jgi:CRP/FNR family transcriptional regulator, cyclic AMP receptor protein